MPIKNTATAARRPADGIPKPGDRAPNFNLKDQNGNTHKLSDYKDKTVVLYFYPRDMTPGCTIEAHGFCDLIDKFKKQGAAILGVSGDSIESHKKFETKENLEITLLSDPDHSAAKAYGVYGEKSFLGKLLQGLKRTTFIIKNGKIAQVYKNVKAKGHAEQVLENI